MALRTLWLWCFAWVVAQPIAHAHTRGHLTLEGNVLLPDEVYFTLLRWDERDRPLDEASVKAIAAAIESFLRTSGYELAKVRGYAEDGHGVISLNEGRLERVVFRGRGTLQTLRYKLELSVPSLVYNRPLIERQLEALNEKYGFEARAVVVKLPELRHTGFQFDLKDVRPVEEVFRERYELQINFPPEPLGTGLRLHLRYGGTDGLQTGASYGVKDLFLSGDHLSARGDFALRQFAHLTRPGTDLRVSRVLGHVRWLPPILVAGGLRPLLAVNLDLHRRQRDDLGLERYGWLTGDAMLGLSITPTDGVLFALAMGYEERHLVDVMGIAEDPPQPREGDGPFVEVQAEKIFDPDNVRLDKRHELVMAYRNYLGGDIGTPWRFEWEYQFVHDIGFHEVWLVSEAVTQGGPVPFPEEEPLKSHIRGLFTNVFGRQVVGLSGAFRYSIFRDVFKLGVFADNAVLAGRIKTTGATETRYATGVGISGHMLIMDYVQLDMAWGVGFITQGGREMGLSGRLRRAF